MYGKMKLVQQRVACSLQAESMLLYSFLLTLGPCQDSFIDTCTNGTKRSALCSADDYSTAAGFYNAVWGFAVIILVAAPLFAATDFVGDRLRLEWRSWLTKNILSAYYANRSFYKLHSCDESLDNPDQASAVQRILPP